MRKAGWFIAALVLSTGAALSQKASVAQSSRAARAAAAAADKAAYETVCGSCHPAGMANDLRSESDWRDTVDEMVKNGANGTGEQFDAVMRYLRDNLTKINVNTAKASEIVPVLAVSDAVAQAIVQRRTKIGGFKTIEELKQVPGVDGAKLEARKGRVVF